jgi:hypothetical protein
LTEPAIKPASEHYRQRPARIKAIFIGSIGNLCVGLPCAITVSMFGGTAPAIALYFKTIGHEEWFYYYLAGIICLSLSIYHARHQACLRDAPPRVADGRR